MSFSTWTTWILGVFSRQGIYRLHASPIQNINSMESGTLGFDLYPICHGDRVRYLSACNVPSHTRNVGACSGCSVLGCRCIENLWVYIFRFVVDG